MARERFTLLQELGRGGMGTVWKARDEETGQIVAVKVLHATLATDPEYVSRFERELELAKRIHSANVTRVLGYGTRDGAPYLVLEYVDGPSLHEALKAHGPYTWPETAALMGQIAQGLADANAAGVIHRDIKPSNVLIAPDGTVKLTDFGIAKGLDLTRLTATSTILGTPAYLAPEGTKDERSDLYSLGIIGYELMTGSTPFKGTSYQDVIVEHIRTPPDLSKLPEEARPIIGSLLAKDPADRPQRASALLPLLYRVGSGGPDPSPRPRPTPNPAPGVRPPTPSPLPLPQAPSTPSGWPSTAAPYYPTPGWVPPRRSNTPILLGLGAVALVVCLVGGILVIGAQVGSARPGSAATSTPEPSVIAVASDLAGLTAAPTATPGPTMRYGSGNWAALDPYPLAVWAPASAVLHDGRVLVMGGLTGQSGSSAIANSYILDPGTGAWTATGSLNAPRGHGMAVTIPDGSVLVAGGVANGQPLDTAERYDPVTGAWTPVGRMSEPRTLGTLTLLQDGRVLATGGGITGAPSRIGTSSADIFDPATNGWTPVPAMASARVSQTATLLPDGEVMVAGGATTYQLPTGEVTSSVQLFDPRTSKWRNAQPMPHSLHAQGAALLADGRVIVVGGWWLTADDDPSHRDVEIYDPAHDAWSNTGSLTDPRAMYSVEALPDGRVLAIGGLDGSNGVLASCEMYDPQSGRWTLTGTLPVGVVWAAVDVLPDGQVVVVGGTRDVNATLPSAGAYIFAAASE